MFGKTYLDIQIFILTVTKLHIVIENIYQYKKAENISGSVKKDEKMAYNSIDNWGKFE